MIQCLYGSIGHSGFLQRSNTLCVLFSNVVVEGIVLALWAFYLLHALHLVAALLGEVLLPALVPWLARRRYLRSLLRRIEREDRLYATGADDDGHLVYSDYAHRVSAKEAIYVYYVSS